MESHEFQKQYDEAREIMHNVAISQQLAKFHEAKQLLEYVEAVQRKEVALKARLGP